MAFALLCFVVKIDAKPLSNLQVTMRGHTYEISDVETVDDVQKALEKSSGVDPKKQGRVLFGGKRLSSGSSLQEAGVSDGAKLNLVPGKTSTKNTSNKPAAAVSTPTATTDSSSSSSSTTPSDMTEQMNEFMKSMGIGGDGGGAEPDMKQAMESMGSLMNSPIFQEFMSDPEKLEQSRQMILNNPLLKSMMAAQPGMEAMLNDPVAWREAMQAAANLYKNMDPEDLMKAMMGDGGGGMPSGMLDGLDSTPMAALDELSEGED